jgi:hypothetical protein
LSPGCTELGCHPADGCDLNTMNRHERLEELRVLCHPSVRAAIKTMGIELRSFQNLPHEHEWSLRKKPAAAGDS